MVRIFGRASIQGALAAALVATTVVLPAGARAATPSLTVSAAFTKPSYAYGQAMAVTVTIHNTGTTTATGIRANQDSDGPQFVPDAGRLGRLGDRVTIAAGHTLTETIIGHPGR